MNTEELEKSLRSEFEDHFKRVLEQARDEVANLQLSVEAELDKHRAQMDEAFRVLNAKLDVPAEFDEPFLEAVTEHLRLARDEGARVTATAMGEAEKLNLTPIPADGGYSKLRDAIAAIRSKTTQAAILGSLVESAAHFAPRGAFFIVKNDHLVGWKVFGTDTDETAARAIHFPCSSETILSDAINSLSMRSGSPQDPCENEKFLEPLGFDSPERMSAIPLTARGRGVAVLYADGGPENSRVNTEALETLVSVAGLTVELLAGAAPQPAEQIVQKQEASQFVQAREAAPAQEDAVETEYAGSVAVEEETAVEQSVAVEEEALAEPEDVKAVVTDEPVITSDFAFSQNNFSEDPADEVAAEDEQPVAAEPVAEEPRRKFSHRDMDLPIEVSDDERRPHSEARRFARLLVSEIKLYNEAKVSDGRESGEIYEVLREAIDRSREMYDKRVQPDVASKFDYFHYELVNNLAEGDEEKLGAGYLALKA